MNLIVASEPRMDPRMPGPRPKTWKKEVTPQGERWVADMDLVKREDYDALRELESAGEAMGATVDRGHIVSRDRTHALIVVDIDFDPFVVSEATRTALTALVPGGRTTVVPNGADHFAPAPRHAAADAPLVCVGHLELVLALLGVSVLVLGLLRGRWMR